VDSLPDSQEVVVVGAGPAGLTAAIYLSRFRRRCVVLEDGHSRAAWIPRSHNIPGFTTGIGGQEFLGSLKRQAVQYGAEIRRAHASSLSINQGVFEFGTDLGTLHSRFAILATGVRDHLPAIEGASQAVQRGLLRVCPICDAYEAIDMRIAVIGDGALGEREAKYLQGYSAHVALLHIGPPSRTPAAAAHPADGIERIPVQLSQLRIEENRFILSAAQGTRDFDVVYLALGCSAQHDLALSLSAKCDEHGALQVNAHQETSVPGLYAAGDVVRGLNQAIVAAAESAIAATDIHNKLRG
jgi:thioredoxin reductase (NADPH)